MERLEGQGRQGEVVNFTVLDCEQRSDEWRAARAGRLTGSRAADMLAKIKTGEAAARRDLRLQLALERVVGTPQEDDYISKEMQRGIDLEAVALGEYEILTGNAVQKTGFLSHKDHMAGCSLDGHVSQFVGIVECKCPKSATHLRYLRSGVFPSDYVGQGTHNMWVSGARWCDFISFDDRFPVELQLFVVRMVRDDARIAEYEATVIRFLAEVDGEVAGINAMRLAA